MTTHRSTGRTAGTTTRWDLPGHGAREVVRSGTVLRVVRGLLTTACLLFLVPSLLGGETGGGERAEPFVGNTLPGAIGAQGHPQAGPRPEPSLAAALQPVAIRGPAGMTISVETFEGWSPPTAATPFKTTLLVGATYRLRVAGIRGYEGLELFPTVRVLARLAAPPGMERRFPVEIQLDEDDLLMAVEGAHVRRVVYMECDPNMADVSEADWFDVRPCDDPLDVAAELGSPVAEIVIGNRQPAPGVVP